MFLHLVQAYASSHETVFHQVCQDSAAMATRMKLSLRLMNMISAFFLLSSTTIYADDGTPTRKPSVINQVL